MRRYTEILAVLALSAGMALHAQTNEMVIQTRKLGAEIQPTMYGLFLRILIMLLTADFMPNWSRTVHSSSPTPNGVEDLWKSNIAG